MAWRKLLCTVNIFCKKIKKKNLTWELRRTVQRSYDIQSLLTDGQLFV